MPFTYEYPRPAVTVDVVLFSARGPELSVLLIRRRHAPFRGSWALPGGFVDESESLEHAALRELHEETSVGGVRIEQLGAWGDPGRDPRGHTVSVAYWAFLHTPPRAVASDDAAEVQWMPLTSLDLRSDDATEPAPRAGRRRPARGLATLAFDHDRIILAARERLRDRLSFRAPDLARTLVELVPARFTLGELQHVVEVALGRQIDRRNFRAKLLAEKVVEPALGIRSGKHRPAQLHRFTERPALDAPPPPKPIAVKKAPKKAAKRRAPARGKTKGGSSR
jgi:8-oxo-dGTP diphosphatase